MSDIVCHFTGEKNEMNKEIPEDEVFYLLRYINTLKDALPVREEKVKDKAGKAKVRKGSKEAKQSLFSREIPEIGRFY